MANSYSKIYIQVVFAVQARQALIDPTWEDELFKYISGIINGKGQIMLAINGAQDHIHIFFAMRPMCCLSDLIREVKKASTAFINAKNLTKRAFRWQDGFGCFSYSAWDKDKIVNYVMNQKKHHQKQSFRKEYTGILRDNEIEFENQYLFEWLSE